MVESSPGCLETPPVRTTRTGADGGSSSMTPSPSPSPLNLAPAMNAASIPENSVKAAAPVKSVAQSGTSEMAPPQEGKVPVTVVIPSQVQTPPEAKTEGLSRKSSQLGLSVLKEMPPKPNPTVPTLPTSSAARNEKSNTLLSEDSKRKLHQEVDAAKAKVKEDKSAAKQAVQNLKKGFVQPGVAEQLSQSRGRGKGRGKGRGTGPSTTAEAETTEMELPEIQEELEEESEGGDSETTLRLGQEPKPKKRPASAVSAKAKPSAATPTPKTKSKAKSKAKAKAKAAMKGKRVRNAKAKLVFRSRVAKNAKTSSKSESTETQKGESDDLTLKGVYHKHLRDTIAKLKEEGMPASEALVNARSMPGPHLTVSLINVK